MERSTTRWELVVRERDTRRYVSSRTKPGHLCNLLLTELDLIILRRGPMNFSLGVLSDLVIVY